MSGGGKAAVGACCALVIGGSAVTVPVVEHHRTAPAPTFVAATVPHAVPQLSNAYAGAFPHKAARFAASYPPAARQ